MEIEKDNKMKTKKHHYFNVNKQFASILGSLKAFKLKRNNILTEKAQAITHVSELDKLIANVNKTASFKTNLEIFTESGLLARKSNDARYNQILKENKALVNLLIKAIEAIKIPSIQNAFWNDKDFESLVRKYH
jgi:hypothetical protein